MLSPRACFHSIILFLIPFTLALSAAELPIELAEIPVFNKESKPDLLATFKKDDEILVLIFAASTCPVCSTYWKRLKGTWYNFRDNKVKMVIVGGNSDDRYDELHKILEKAEFDIPLVWDSKHILASKLGIEFTPAVVVIGRNWKPLYSGKIDDFWRDEEKVKTRYLDDAITRALDDKKTTDHLNDTFLGSRMR